MKYVIITWMVMISLLFLAASCTKEEPKHRDIVTATINGKPWKAGCKESPPFGCSIADLQYYTDTGGFSLRATNIEEDIGIRIRLFEVFDKGIYTIPTDQNCGGMTLGTNNCEYWQFFISDQELQEIQIINIDHADKIIEGTFHFVGNDNSACMNDPVFIKDGYFKMKYRP